VAYVVLALKYRPQSFEEMVGQSVVATTLANAIKTGRLAQAYVFAGPRGTGKTSMARIFAKALNCEKGPTPTPCNTCDLCKSIDRGDDVDVLEIDAASNRRIDDVRELRDHVRYRPARGRFKIYYLDEAHMLTREAWNALLKTLEEPPEHVKFIFSTTAAEKMPETILSRCQRFDFRNLSSNDIVARLQQIAEAESIETAPGVLQLLARRARGGMRDAISLLDQLHAAVEGTITREDAAEILGLVSTEAMVGLFQSFLEHDDAAVLHAVAEAVAQGKDLGEFLAQAIDHAQVLLHLQVLGRDPVCDVLGPEEAERLRDQARNSDTDQLLQTIEILARTRLQLKNVIDGQVLVEAALLELARLGELQPLGELIQKVEALSRGEGAAAKGSSGNSAKPASTLRDQRTRKNESRKASALVPADLRRVSSFWPDLANEVEGLAGQLLTHLRPAGVSGNELLVTWNDEGRLEDTSVLAEALEAASTFLSTRLDRTVTVRLQPAEDVPEAEDEVGTTGAGASRQSRGATRVDEPIIHRAVELFGGTVVEGDE